MSVTLSLNFDTFSSSDGDIGTRSARKHERCDRLSNPPQAEGNPGGPGFTSRPVFKTFFFQGRHRAEDLNERTMIWSVFVTFAIMCVGFGQASFP